jgi:hypothetical protein
LGIVNSRSEPEPRDLRASDADREKIVSLLRDAASDGRLTLDEHSERVERAYAARTLGELKDLTGDLVRPDARTGAVDPAADGLPDVSTRPMMAVFGVDKREGRWVVPARQLATAIFGTIKLDFREALLQQRHVVVQATVIFSSVELIVPEGVQVRFSGGAAILGSKENKVRAEPGPDAPVIEIQAFCLLGSVQAKSPKRPPRWLRGFGRD